MITKSPATELREAAKRKIFKAIHGYSWDECSGAMWDISKARAEKAADDALALRENVPSIEEISDEAQAAYPGYPHERAVFRQGADWCARKTREALGPLPPSHPVDITVTDEMVRTFLAGLNAYGISIPGYALRNMLEAAFVRGRANQDVLPISDRCFHTRRGVSGVCGKARAAHSPEKILGHSFEQQPFTSPGPAGATPPSQELRALEEATQAIEALYIPQNVGQLRNHTVKALRAVCDIFKDLMKNEPSS